MLKSFLLISFRNINSSGSLVLNVLSLAIGMAACVLIYSFVYYELSFDKFHEDGDSLVRLETNQSNSIGEASKNAYTSFDLGESIKDNDQSIAFLTRVMPYSENGDGFFRIYKHRFSCLITFLIFFNLITGKSL